MYLTYFNLLMYNYLFDIDIYSVYVKRLSKETKRKKVNGFFHDIITLITLFAASGKMTGDGDMASVMGFSGFGM